MLIDCPGCAKSYHIDRSALGPHGRNVVCSHCQTRWRVSPDAHAMPDGDAEALRIAPEIQVEASSGRARQPTYEELYGSPAPTFAEPTLRPSIKPPRTALGFGAALALLCGIIGLRGAVVHAWPQSSAAYKAAGLEVNERGLDFRNVHASLVHEGDRALLLVDGEIANRRPDTNLVPAIRLAVRDAIGQEIYSWDAASPKSRLNGGETVAFRARLATPPADGQALFVRFASAEPTSHK